MASNTSLTSTPIVEPKNKFHTIIVGAGASGLLIAQGLKKVSP